MNKNNNNNQDKIMSKFPKRLTEYNDNSTDTPIKQWLNKRNNKIAIGVIIILIICFIGFITYQHYTSANNSHVRTSRQARSNRKKRPVMISKNVQTMIMRSLLNAENTYSVNGGKVPIHKEHSNQLRTITDKRLLAQFYLHGVDNPSFKRTFKQCKRLASHHVKMQAVLKNLNIHYLGNHTFKENYRVDYRFTHAHVFNSHDIATKYQVINWQSTNEKIKQHGQYHWVIINARPIKEFRPSDEISK